MTDQLEAFRAEARAWLDASFPKSLKNDETWLQDFMVGKPMTGEAGKWRDAMAAKGWGAPTWPKAYGGGGLTPAEARVLMQEMARAGARNPIIGMGTSMFGPTLLEYGTEAQKQRHIPPIVRGETRWCQGYSEPGAGSDLASLQTKCEDKGDHYLINGQKIWTSGAQYADWCFCLVRTDTTKKHEGISFILIDMLTPGVETRPIKLIAGSSPFCETFFTDVRVPKENLVGPLNGGWTVGKRLLQFERQGQGANSGGANRRGEDRPLEVMARDYVGVDSAGRVSDQDLRARIAANQIDAKAMALTVQRVAAEARGANSPSAATSVMKNAQVGVAQTRMELGIEIMGNRAFGWEGAGFSEDECNWVRNWLSGKAMSIYGGSNEVQSNIVAKRILGLPDHLGAGNH
jgi:alkylation response protein AidB-like acyl-CoA dehydrogenase